MKIRYGNGSTEYGPGVDINLTGDEVASALSSYLVAHNIYILGARTVTVNGRVCKKGNIYVDPSGNVVAKGKVFSGRGENHE